MSQRTKIVDVAETGGLPCAACPWRVENHGRRHPDGWYTKTNRRRLWQGLKNGVTMTCHPTDPDNAVPEGARGVPAGTATKTCAGALILQVRELALVNTILTRGGEWRDYRSLRPRGLSLAGAASLAWDASIGKVPVIGGRNLSTEAFDLDLAVGMEHLPWPVDLGRWS